MLALGLARRPTATAAAAGVSEAPEGWLTGAQAERLRSRAAAAGAGHDRRDRLLPRALHDRARGRRRRTARASSRSTRTRARTAARRRSSADRTRGDADHDAFRANLAAAGVAERVRHVRKLSADALGDVDGALALLYVDGAHRFGPARDDVARWGARVAPGGTMLVHDSFSSIGVTGALLAECVARGGWRYAGRTGSLAEYERLAAPAARPRARPRRRAPARPAALVRPQRALQGARRWRACARSRTASASRPGCTGRTSA